MGGERTSAARLCKFLKAAAFVVSIIIVVPLVVMVWLEKVLSRSEVLFAFCSQALAPVPGFLGWWLRGAYYFATLKQCSWETHIGFGSLFTHREAVVGARLSTGAYCILGRVRAGCDVRMGSRVSIPSGKRQHLDEAGRLADVNRFDDVSVGSGCWIGEGAILLATVGDHSIVSAGAVVTKDMPRRSLIGGNPARVLRPLDQDMTAARAEEDTSAAWD